MCATRTASKGAAPGAAQALFRQDETLCKRALMLVGLTGGNSLQPSTRAGDAKLRMGTTPARFLTHKWAYYAAPRWLGSDRGLGRPAGGRRFENVPAFRLRRMLPATTRADRASALVRTISAALLPVSGGNWAARGLRMRQDLEWVLLGRIGPMRKKETASGSSWSCASGSTWVFCCRCACTEIRGAAPCLEVLTRTFKPKSPRHGYGSVN